MRDAEKEPNWSLGARPRTDRGALRHFSALPQPKDAGRALGGRVSGGILDLDMCDRDGSVATATAESPAAPNAPRALCSVAGVISSEMTRPPRPISLSRRRGGLGGRLRSVSGSGWQDAEPQREPLRAGRRPPEQVTEICEDGAMSGKTILQRLGTGLRCALSALLLLAAAAAVRPPVADGGTAGGPLRIVTNSAVVLAPTFVIDAQTHMAVSDLPLSAFHVWVDEKPIPAICLDSINADDHPWAAVLVDDAAMGRTKQVFSSPAWVTWLRELRSHDLLGIVQTNAACLRDECTSPAGTLLPLTDDHAAAARVLSSLRGSWPSPKVPRKIAFDPGLAQAIRLAASQLAPYANSRPCIVIVAGFDSDDIPEKEALAVEALLRNAGVIVDTVRIGGIRAALARMFISAAAAANTKGTHQRYIANTPPPYIPARRGGRLGQCRPGGFPTQSFVSCRISMAAISSPSRCLMG